MQNVKVLRGEKCFAQKALRRSDRDKSVLPYLQQYAIRYVRFGGDTLSRGVLCGKPYFSSAAVLMFSRSSLKQEYFIIRR